MEPLEKILVLLQSNLHDSAVFKVIPDYLAKTDEQGFFMIDNMYYKKEANKPEKVVSLIREAEAAQGMTSRMTMRVAPPAMHDPGFRFGIVRSGIGLGRPISCASSTYRDRFRYRRSVSEFRSMARSGNPSRFFNLLIQSDFCSCSS